tara:strand:- start:437 stop:1072 length:636 start_codon:yes stop_codon:yes gene_type:complete
MKINHKFGAPQYDDIEAELTILFLLHSKPKNMIEFSPCTGWSTSFILDTLSLNDNNSILSSYDILDRCSAFIKWFNRKNVEWKFEVGDVTKKFNTWNLDTIDYLFIDSDHSTEFSIKYINDLLIPLLERCKLNNKKVIVSVHDVYHGRKNEPIEEGKEVINFLSKNNIEYYTVAKSCNKNYNIINNFRHSLGITENIHQHDTNPSIFFILE